MRTPKRFDTSEGPRWRVRYRAGTIETSETFRRKADAERFAEILGNGKDGRTEDALAWLEARQSKADVVTFSDWFDTYRSQLTGITPRTRADYEAIHQRYLTRFDQMPLTLITRAHVANLVNDLEAQRLSTKTIKNAVYLLSSVMSEAVEEGHIGRSPVRKLRLPRPEAHDDLVRFMTADEAGALVDATPERYQPFVVFLLGTGLRWSEATALQGRHVNLDTGTVLVRQAWKRIPGGQELGPPKSAKARRTVNASTLALLAANSVMRKAADFVFVGPQGRPLRHGNFYNRVWRPACEKAELDPRPRIHDTRHTFASWLISEGASLEQVQDQLGHESYEMTRRIYAHLLPAVGVEAGRMASAAMQRALGDRVQFPVALGGKPVGGSDERDETHEVATQM